MSRNDIADALDAMQPGQTVQFDQDYIKRLDCDCGDCYLINDDPKRYCLVSVTDYLVTKN